MTVKWSQGWAIQTLIREDIGLILTDGAKELSALKAARSEAFLDVSGEEQLYCSRSTFAGSICEAFIRRLEGRRRSLSSIAREHIDEQLEVIPKSAVKLALHCPPLISPWSTRLVMLRPSSGCACDRSES